ncbi:MAG: efflux RND transporter permease subunit, partial [Phycisphaerae bacterium]|nr:efflux RND transporter permease subunit [Phycisphaerae bacterium]
MNLSTPFIQRPVMTLLSMISLLLFGVVAYRSLAVSDLPNVDRPTIQVNANLGGASADTMATAVATPLEKELSTIAGIDSMSSSNSQGSTSITLDFVLERNIDDAAQDVNAAISWALRRLPTDMTTPPSYRKVNPADQPILFLVLTSPDRPMYELDEYGQTLMAQRISMVDGVAQVQVYGSQKRAVRAELDPYQLAYRGIGIDEVPNAIDQQNVNKPLGTLSGKYRAYTIQATGQLLQASEYEPLVVVYRNGRPTRLEELGRVSESVENDKTAAWFVRRGLSERAIILAIQRQPGTNTVDVADAVKALLPDFRDKLPASVSLEIMRDSSGPIRESAHDVQFTLLLTLGLVVMVIFLFLRNVSATIIPSLVLPMSVIGTFIVMYALNYSLDNLSLMALTLSVGFVVDDAIVMLENIVRHMEMGKPRLQAALEGSREVGFTIVSMTISLAAVFIPVLFLGGIMGRLLREFSVTIGAAVLVSGFVSLTLTPMLSSRFLKNPHEVHHGVIYRISEWCFNLMLAIYSWMLLKVLKHRRIAMIFSAGVLWATVWLFGKLPQDLFPSEDRDLLEIRTEAGQDTSFDAMSEYQAKLGAIIADNPNVKYFMNRCGSGPAGGSANTGGMSVVLRPRSERTDTADQIINQLRPKLNTTPGVRANVSNPPAINVTGRRSTSQYMLTLQAYDTEQLYRDADELERNMRKMPRIVDVSSDMQLKNQEVTLELDRDQATAHGVTPAQIEDALFTAYGARQ